MISQAKIHEYLEEELSRQSLFLVEATVHPGNRIVVYIDSMKGVTIDECIAVSRYLEGKLDRSKEDFELEVSSPGLDKPLKIPVQFEKNTGRLLEIVKTDGIKVTGRLLGTGNGKVQIETEVKVKDARTGKKKMEQKILDIRQEDIKSAKIVISVKK